MAASVHDDWISPRELELREKGSTLGRYAPIRYDPPPLTSYTGTVPATITPWQFDVYSPMFNIPRPKKSRHQYRTHAKIFQIHHRVNQRIFEYLLDLDDWKICAVYINKRATTALDKQRAVKESRNAKFSRLPKNKQQPFIEAVGNLHVVEALLLSTDIHRYEHALLSEIRPNHVVPFIKIRAYSNGSIISIVRTNNKGITKKKILALKKRT